MSSTLVSVVVATYNRANTVGHAIQSILGQTHKNVEVIVVDDGSTDETQAKLRDYGSRIRVITQANAGPAAARNRGIDVAEGDIIAFQDSDDLWRPTKLERQVALLGKAGESVPCCLCNASLGIVRGKERTSFDIASIRFPSDEGVWLNVAEVLASRFVLFNQTVAIRRWAIEKAGGFDEELGYLEDYDLALRLALEGPWAFIREPLVTYRTGDPNSLSQQAVRDPVALKHREIAIVERAMTTARSRNDEAMRRQLAARLVVFRRLLLSSKLCQSESWVARVSGRLIGTLEHCRQAALRRLSLGTKVRTAPPQSGYPCESRSEGQGPTLLDVDSSVERTEERLKSKIQAQ